MEVNIQCLKGVVFWFCARSSSNHDPYKKHGTKRQWCFPSCHPSWTLASTNRPCTPRNGATSQQPHPRQQRHCATTARTHITPGQPWQLDHHHQHHHKHVQYIVDKREPTPNTPTNLLPPAQRPANQVTQTHAKQRERPPATKPLWDEPCKPLTTSTCSAHSEHALRHLPHHPSSYEAGWEQHCTTAWNKSSQHKRSKKQPEHGQRMLLQRPWGTRTLPKDEWRARVTAFQAGEWQQLLATTGPTEGDPAGPPAATHHPAPSSERRAERARHLVHQGELSAARQALTASPLAPGTAATLAQLRDPTRRPTEPYTPLQANIDQFVPEQPLRPPTNSHSSATLQKGCRPRPIWPHSGHTATCFGWWSHHSPLRRSVPTFSTNTGPTEHSTSHWVGTNGCTHQT